MNLDPEKVKQFQRGVGADDDGVFGPATLDAGLDFVAKHSPAPAEPPVPAQPPAGLVDARSEAIIATLHPQVQQPFRDLLHSINAAIAPRIGKWISGYRGEEEQNADYAKGRTAPGPIVTHAPWPYSSHNGGGGKVGFACDLGIFTPDGNYLDDAPEYDVAGHLSRAQGFHWGADFGDTPHHCKRPPSCDGMTETQFIAEMIRRVENGIPVWP